MGRPGAINTLREHFNLWVKETILDRDHLKNYFNIEYPLIYLGTWMEDKIVYFSFFPWHIHIVILGASNDVIKNIEKYS